MNKAVNISIPKGLAKALNCLVDETSLGFISKSEVLRCAFDVMLSELQKESQRREGAKVVPPMVRGSSRRNIYLRDYHK